MHFGSPEDNMIAVLEGYEPSPCPCALGQAPEAGGAAAGIIAGGGSFGRAVAIGVTVGLTVWFLTRMLDGKKR